MTASLEDLVTEEDEESVVQFFLTQLADRGWPVTNWGPMGVGRSLVHVFARGVTDLSATIASIAKGGFLDLATGAWLDLLAEGIYQLSRFLAVFAVIKVRLTRTSGGPTTWASGALWIRTPDGRRYNSRTGGTLSATVGATLDLEFRADQAGVLYNLTLGDTISFVTPPVGVSLALTETVTGSGSCMVVAGVDTESDEDLRERCRTKWATLGVEKTRDAYVFLARNAFDTDGNPILGVTKVLVDDSNPGGPGTVDIYLAGDAGAITDPGVVSDVDGYLQARKGLCAVLTTQGATNDTVTITATVTVKAAFLATAKQEIRANLQRYQAELEIGDGDAGTYTDNAIRAQIIEFLMAPAGVVNATVTTPASDYVPALGHIPLLAYSLDGGGATITMVPV